MPTWVRLPSLVRPAGGVPDERVTVGAITPPQRSVNRQRRCESAFAYPCAVPYHWSNGRRRYLLVCVWGFRVLLVLFTLLTLVGVVLAVAHGRWGSAARLIAVSIPPYLVVGFFAWWTQRQLDGPVWGHGLPDDPTKEQRYEAWRSSREARVAVVGGAVLCLGAFIVGLVTRQWGLVVVGIVGGVCSVRPTLRVFGVLPPRSLDGRPPD